MAILKKENWQERESVSDSCHDRTGKLVRRSGEKLGQNSSERQFSDARQLGCVFQDMTPADHAPEAGVAQGMFHGILVRHHGRIQEEVEEGLENKVERREEEDNTQEQVRMPMTMDGNEDTQTRLEPHVTV